MYFDMEVNILKVFIISDIHGNLNAISAVIHKIRNIRNVDGFILLGDIIDYGMHSNEVIEIINNLPYEVLCNIRGNHELAVLNPTYLNRFSSDRGRESSKYTRSILNKDSWKYLREKMANSGSSYFMLGDKKCLAIHGSIEDMYWKAIMPDQDLKAYSEFDYVFSGHSHMPHYFERFFSIDRPEFRNKKKTIFINPGSVGQPRNLNPAAQFAIFDTETEAVEMLKVPYDVKKEQAAYHGQVDDFYRLRLVKGI